MPAALLYESPFTDLSPSGPEGLFTLEQVEELVGILDNVRGPLRRLESEASWSVGRHAVDDVKRSKEKVLAAGGKVLSVPRS